MTDKIYLSGPIEQSSDPERWRTDLKEATSYNNIEFLDPLNISMYDKTPEEIVKKSLSLLNKSDGMIVHYEHEVHSDRVPMEVIVSNRSDRPVVVWTDRYNGMVKNMDPFLQYFADEFQQNGRPAVTRLLKLM